RRRWRIRSPPPRARSADGPQREAAAVPQGTGASARAGGAHRQRTAHAVDRGGDEALAGGARVDQGTHRERRRRGARRDRPEAGRGERRGAGGDRGKGRDSLPRAGGEAEDQGSAVAQPTKRAASRPPFFIDVRGFTAASAG